MIFNKEVLLLHRDNIPHIENPNTWCLPGGTLEKNEDKYEGLLHELQEETSIAPQNNFYLGSYDLNNYEIAYLFLSTLTETEKDNVKLGNEGQELRFFSFGELSNLPLASNLNMLLAKYSDILREMIEQGTEKEIIKSQLQLSP